MAEKPTKLTVKDVLTSSGRYPEREQLADENVQFNATVMAAKISLLAQELGYTGKINDVSSGFRPQLANAATPGSAKRSLHMEGRAVDLVGQEFGKFIRAHADGPEALRRNKLFMESLEQTVGKYTGWTHIDNGDRPDRPNREFKA